MKLSANLSLLFTEQPLSNRVVAARVAGFSGVEIQFPYELAAVRLKDLLERAGVPLVLMNLPAGDLMSGGIGLASSPSRIRAFEAALQEALTYAAMARPLAVNVLAGRLEPETARSHALEVLVGNLKKTAQAFSVLGIPVLCEAINPLDMPDFLVNTPDDLLELLERVDHPNFYAQLDVYHMARQGFEVRQCIERLAGRIGHVQFADCPGRGAPGSGTIDFSSLLACLHAVGYRGWLGAEYKPDFAGTEASLYWMAHWFQWEKTIAESGQTSTAEAKTGFLGG